MSVIIRLQNLPWSANAMDIRQFFRGLSIPEGGVHIVGGEMGDAFIAFSTDEDARQAMMHDRDSIKEVQVRLLLSSRAEMQKVIEKARLTSLSVFQQLAAAAAAATAPAARATPMPAAFPIANKPATATVGNSALPNGPTASFLAYQQQAGITLSGSPISATDFDANNKNSAKKDEPPSKHSERSYERERRRSTSKDRRELRRRHEDSRSRSRERERERGRNRDRDRDGGSRRYDRARRSSSRGSRERDRSSDRSRGRSYNRTTRRSESKERDPRLRREAAMAAAALWEHGGNNAAESAEKPKTTPAWSAHASNSYQTNSYQAQPSNAYSTITNKENVANAAPAMTVTADASTAALPTTNLPEIVISAFQNYTTTTISNNYSVNMYGGNSNSNSSSDATALKHCVLQNPYTTAQQQQQPPSISLALAADPMISNVSKGLMPTEAMSASAAANDATPLGSFASVDQESIAFAKTNPYEQMYPNLFAQAAAQQMPRSNATAAQRMNSPSCRANDTNAYPESSSIKISEMCINTNYSDLRKFFAGLFIPHNGIKMVNDKNGMRSGVAFIQFSRSNSVPKALLRNHSMLKSSAIQIEAVSDEEFIEAEDGCRSHGRFDRPNYNDSDKDRNRFDGGNNTPGGDQPRGQSRKLNDEPFTVLYLEELPPLTTEQDLMKMFSSYSLYDILLMPSAENRREYVAHVKFSLAEDARAALDDKSKHMIGYRKVRVYPGRDEDMERAKEKLRLANEQLLKEEQEEAMRAAALEAAELERQSMLECKQEAELDDEPLADIKMEDMSMSPTPSMQMRDPRANRDPRLIPSLLEIAPAKPPGGYDDAKANSARNMPPTDPRLRARTRPSRFDTNDDNDSKASPPANDPMMNNNNNNISITNNGHEHLSRNAANPFINMPNNNVNGGGGINNNNNFNSEMPMQPQMPFQRNMMENNFVYIFNCPYSTCQMDIADLFRSANMLVKHVELLNNERGQPSGEFIVEVFNARDADIALNEFNNLQFRGRGLRVRPITPQGIADRLKKPFMNYIPGGGGGGGGNGSLPYNYNNNNKAGGGMMMNVGNMRGNNNRMSDSGMNFKVDMGMGGGNNHMSNDSPSRHGRHGSGGGGGGSLHRAALGRRSRHNNNNNYNNENDDQSEDSGDFDKDNYIGNDATTNKKNSLDNENFSDINNGGGGGMGGGIPEKFTRSNCVIAMGNVPYKADLQDILRFFSGFSLRPDDIVRRFNDDGSATSDARVAFSSPADAKAAYGKCNRKQIFNRTIYLSIL